MATFKKYDGSDERTVLVGMVTSKVVLGAIAAKWERNSLSSRWANIVGDICVEYYNEHKRAPRDTFRSLCLSWVENGRRDENTVEDLNRFLGSLEEEYTGKVNPDHVIGLASRCINKVKIKGLIDGLNEDLETSDIPQAASRISSFHKTEMGPSDSIDFFTDEQAIRSVFERERLEPLFEYPGDAGMFFRHILERDTLLAVQGPEKSGKTFTLIDMAFRALLARRKVGFFSVGDMTSQQVMELLAVKAAKQPMFSEDGQWPFTIKLPSSIRKPSQGEECAHVDWKKRTFEKPLDADTAVEACNKLMLHGVKSKKSHFKLECHPSDSISILEILEIVHDWDRQGFTVDVLVIDYADILAPINRKREPRDQIHETWTTMRSICNKLHCLLITGTQADADSYEKKIQTKKNFSGDKRKLGHANALMGINVTGEEKESCISRYNWIVKRKGRSSARRCLHVAGCLDIASPCMVTTF